MTSCTPCRLSVFLLFVSLLPFEMHAQAVSGAITGVVTDATGSGIANATVVVTSTATKVRNNRTTNASGLYTVPSLISANYQIAVSAKGFKTTQTTAAVTIGGITRLDLKLEIGNLQERVSITAEAPLLR